MFNIMSFWNTVINTFRINKPGHDNIGQINYNQAIQFVTIFKLNSKTFA